MSKAGYKVGITNNVDLNKNNIKYNVSYFPKDCYFGKPVSYHHTRTEARLHCKLLNELLNLCNNPKQGT